MSAVIRHVVSSITPASRAQAAAVEARLAPLNAPVLARLGSALAAAQHTAALRIARRTVVVVAADHPAADPGIALGPSHPTVVAAHAIADGTAALAPIARQGRARILLVDAGVAEPAAMPAIAIPLGPRRAPISVGDAVLGLESGIALVVSLADEGLDLLALGAVGLGADLATHAVLAAAGSGLERLAAHGGPDTAVLTGAILAAASMNIPVLLDDHATSTAALIARAIAPDVVGYLVATQTGTPLHQRSLAALGLDPVLGVGLGHGEGVGAAMVLPWIDQVAGLLATG